VLLAALQNLFYRENFKTLPISFPATTKFLCSRMF